MREQEGSLGTNQSVLRFAAYDADDDLRVRREFHEQYSRIKGNFHQWVWGQLPIRGGEQLLDIGTGPGDFPQLLRKQRHRGRIVGMDLSEGMIRTAKQSAPAGAWLVADAQQLPFRDGQFNGTMARHMLYHVPDIDAAVGEMARVTARRGWGAAVTNGRDNMALIYGIWESVKHPAVAAATGAISARFPLEKAADFFRPHFSNVQVIMRDDAAVLPSVEPLVRYLYSGRYLLMKPDHTDAQWAEVQTELQTRAAALWAQHAKNGVLTISKRTGVVIGYRL